MQLKLVMPKDTIWTQLENKSGRSGYNKRCSDNYWDNVWHDNNFIIEKISDKTKTQSCFKSIIQKIYNDKDDIVKTTEIKPENIAAFPVYKSTERLTKDGHYSVTRMVGDKFAGGYGVAPKKRVFENGCRGTLQRAVMLISSDTNGYERPLLGKVGELIFNSLKK